MISLVLEVSIIYFKVYTTHPDLAKRKESSYERVDSKSFTEIISLNPAWITSISISFLYANILSPSAIVITFLSSKGMSTALIAVLTAFCVLFGLLATITFPRLVPRFGLINVGFYSSWFQTLSITLPCLVFLIDPSFGPLGLSLFCIGIGLSRFGLWSVDLAQTQILQDAYPSDIGSVSGLQVSLQNFFELVGYSQTVIWPSPVDFLYPCLVCLCALFISSFLFSLYLVRAKR